MKSTDNLTYMVSNQSIHDYLAAIVYQQFTGKELFNPSTAMAELQTRLMEHMRMVRVDKNYRQFYYDNSSLYVVYLLLSLSYYPKLI